jgi:hypothetical protein
MEGLWLKSLLLFFSDPKLAKASEMWAAVEVHEKRMCAESVKAKLISVKHDHDDFIAL